MYELILIGVGVFFGALVAALCRAAKDWRYDRDYYPEIVEDDQPYRPRKKAE